MRPKKQKRYLKMLVGKDDERTALRPNSKNVIKKNERDNKDNIYV